MRDAEVEGGGSIARASLARRVLAEIVPQPERDRRQLQAAAAAPVVEHLVVAILGGQIGHRFLQDFQIRSIKQSA